MRRIVALVVSLVLVVGLAVLGCEAPDDPGISFTDANLEATIREALSRPVGRIHASDLAGLVSLKADGRGIENLSGLEHCTGLVDLDLSDNQIGNISPLTSLTTLTRLYLDANQISDISPLANLINLTRIGLCGNQISDISPLVLNEGLDAGDIIYLVGNPLSPESLNIYIPQLEARGVIIYYEGPDKFHLTITSTEGGQVTEPGEGTFSYWPGAEVDIVAEADEAYRFVNWTGDVETTAEVESAATTITMHGDYSITANFQGIVQYSLTISSTAGGSVTTPGEGTFTYYEGMVVNLAAVPDEGCYFVNWTGDVGTIANVNYASTTITMHGDYSIVANFAQIPPAQFALTISSTTGGSVTIPGEGTFTYEEGTVVDLVATADADYRFVVWTGDVATIADVNAPSTTITMNGHYSITATFVRLYNLTISGSAGGSVTTPGEGTFTYDAGTEVNLVATPADVYQFAKWAGDVGMVANVNSASTTVTMYGDYSITATFYDPEIWDWYDLDAIRNHLSGNYILMRNLDSTTAGYAELASPTANGGKGWQPIGTSGNPFTGTFDGQVYEIRDLFCDRPDEARVGLFGSVEGSVVIKNLGVVNVDVTGRVSVGALVGYNWRYGTVSNCYSSGSVTGSQTVGGLVGYNGRTVSNSYSTASVTAADRAAGGLVGMMGAVGGAVTDSYFIGSVTGSSCAGGVVGYSALGAVSNSYYNYDDVLINGENIITIGALFEEDFEQWLTNDKFLDVNERLSQDNGYYVISDVGDFKELLGFGQDSTLKFRLEGDLDLATEPNFYIPYLAGHFDGNGHKIWNLSFSSDFVSGVGLFGHLGPHGEVSQVGVENVTIIGNEVVGGLVARIVYSGAVSDSYSTGSVTSVSDLVAGSAGGLVGSAYYGTVSNSYSTASVTGIGDVGGLVGHLSSGTVSNSCAAGSVTGTSNVGGLVGRSYGTVSNSYAAGSVTGTSYVGGLVGFGGGGGGSVSHCYSTGSVTGTYHAGGLVGQNYGMVDNSFWDIQTSGQSTSDGGTGKTTAEMHDIATFSAAGWNIVAVSGTGNRDPDYIWNIVDEQTYPFLSWQPVS